MKELFVSSNCETLIEIGPGKGALTTLIQDLTSQTQLIEYDEKMIIHLRQNKLLSKTTKVVQQDILQREATHSDHFSFQTAPEKTLVVGNLPYYITSPILRKFFETQTPTRAGGVFLIQREAAEKIVYNAPKKSFLRRLINYSYRVE